MNQETNQIADTAIICIINHPELRHKAMATAGDLELFDKLLFPAHALVWDVMKKQYELSGDGSITAYHLLSSLQEMVQEDEAVKGGIALIQIAQQFTQEDIVEEVGLKYFERFRLTAVKRDMLNKISKAYSEDDIMKMINKEQTRFDAPVSANDIVIEMPLMDPEKFMPTSVKIPTGVRWVDQLSFGGHSPGETVGILGPTGGGKTLTATEMLMAQACRKKHCLLVIYEQPLAGDVAERIYCQAFGDRDIDFFRTTPPKRWEESDRLKYAEIRAKVGEYIHVVDFSKGKQGSNGMADVVACVEALEKQGKLPDIVIIDWLWPAVRRFCVGQGIPLERMRAWAGNYIDELKQMNTTKKTTAFLFHQLNTDKSRASPSVRPTVTDAYELRDFSYMLDTCYVIGNRDKVSNVMWLLTDKNRRGQPQEILGKMDGARGTITPATNMIYDSRAGFVPADQVSGPIDADDVEAPDPYL